MNNKMLDTLAKDKRLTGNHIRVYLLLAKGTPMIQSKLCDELSIKKPNLSKIIKELCSWGYIDVHHIEGKNKYLKANNDAKEIDAILKGQVYFDIFD